MRELCHKSYRYTNLSKILEGKISILFPRNSNKGPPEVVLTHIFIKSIGRENSILFPRDLKQRDPAKSRIDIHYYRKSIEGKNTSKMTLFPHNSQEFLMVSS
ncbi:Uncharacterized protein Fot_02250 [Forsythia ovata]|uniref:Uncharacterized protein n=1 Tax=Forsythia ovata TaxID=205694 RepID=A0ABD1X6V7_9LAMI